jgi:hypothetical protein
MGTSPQDKVDFAELDLDVILFPVKASTGRLL